MDAPPALKGMTWSNCSSKARGAGHAAPAVALEDSEADLAREGPSGGAAGRLGVLGEGGVGALQAPPRAALAVVHQRAHVGADRSAPAA